MSDKKSAESFVFYSSFLDVARLLPGRNFERFVLAILEYGLHGNEPNFDEFTKEARLAAKGCFMQIKVGIDSSKRRYISCVENGKRGGAKIGNQNARKRPKNNQENDLKTTKETTKEQPKNDLNYNGNYNAFGNYNYLKGTSVPPSEPNGSASSPVPDDEPYTVEMAVADIEAKAAARAERERIVREAQREADREREEQWAKKRAERLAKAEEMRRMAQEQMTAKEAEVSAG